MHRNERYFHKNEGKHNYFGQWDKNNNEPKNNINEPTENQSLNVKSNTSVEKRDP